MTRVYEKFYIFIKSSFGEKEKKDLYDYIWKKWGRKISFYIANVIPFHHYCFDDVYQDVMLKIYNNLSTFNPLHSFKAWIYKIARHHCLDFIKSKEERQSAQKEKTMDRITVDADPEKRLLHDELLAMIDRFLNSQEAVDREICYLRFYENLRYKEIAGIVGLNASTVRSKVHQIKAKLKAEITRP